MITNVNLEFRIHDSELFERSSHQYVIIMITDIVQELNSKFKG